METALGGLVITPLDTHVVSSIIEYTLEAVWLEDNGTCRTTTRRTTNSFSL